MRCRKYSIVSRLTVAQLLVVTAKKCRLATESVRTAPPKNRKKSTSLEDFDSIALTLFVVSLSEACFLTKCDVPPPYIRFLPPTNPRRPFLTMTDLRTVFCWEALSKTPTCVGIHRETALFVNHGNALIVVVANGPFWFNRFRFHERLLHENVWRLGAVGFFGHVHVS